RQRRPSWSLPLERRPSDRRAARQPDDGDARPAGRVAHLSLSDEPGVRPRPGDAPSGRLPARLAGVDYDGRMNASRRRVSLPAFSLVSLVPLLLAGATPARVAQPGSSAHRRESYETARCATGP